jgi:hypothetical protein
MLKMSQLFKRVDAGRKPGAGRKPNAPANRALGDVELDRIAAGGTGYKPGTTGGQR